LICYFFWTGRQSGTSVPCRLFSIWRLFLAWCSARTRTPPYRSRDIRRRPARGLSSATFPPPQFYTRAETNRFINTDARVTLSKITRAIYRVVLTCGWSHFPFSSCDFLGGETKKINIQNEMYLSTRVHMQYMWDSPPFGVFHICHKIELFRIAPRVVQ